MYPARSHPSLLRCGIDVLLALGLLPATALAQTVIGTVLLPDSSTTVPGAIVVARDSTGVIVRSLTTENGRFVMRLPRAGRYSLRVLRIGFRATEERTVRVAVGDTASVRLVAASSRISLAAVTVRATSQCRVRPDTSLLVAQVWEEARKAMLASQLSAGPLPLVGEWMSYSRALDPSGRIVRAQQVRFTSSPTTTVFRSIRPESLATAGYVVADSSGTTFHAPDAAVLLSESFVATHCFRIAESRKDEPALIGVVFEPTASRRTARDITGTAWVERSSAELRSVDFLYTNLPRTRSNFVGGGTVEFTRLDGGSWIVSSWNARLPVPEEMPKRTLTHAFGESFSPEPEPSVRSIQMTGGDVGRITRGDSVLFVRAGASVRIQLASSDGLVPVAGASIALGGTNYASTTDSAGFVTIGPLPAGRYVASIVVPRLDSLYVRPMEQEVEAHRVVSVDTLALPAATRWLAQRCARDSSTAGTAILRGVVQEGGFALSGVAVSITFPRVDARGLRSGAVRWRDESMTTATDAGGRWQFCGIPHQTEIRIRAAAAGGAAESRVTLSSTAAYPFVELELRPTSDPAPPRRLRPPR